MSGLQREWLPAAALGTLLAWLLLSGSGEASRASWRAPARATAAFHQAPGSVSLGTRTPGGSNRGGLPNTTQDTPTVGLRCSAESAGAGTLTCSVAPGVALLCSVLCDSGDACSAFVGAGGGRTFCSTVSTSSPGRHAAVVCTIIQVSQGLAPALCSAGDGQPGSGETLLCSAVTIVPDVNVCSAENPSTGPGNFCSATGNSGGSSTLFCSIVGGAAGKNVCTVLFPAAGNAKLCSTRVPSGPDADSAFCSIRSGQKGYCTAFISAPPSSCSVLVGPGKCSVIGPGGSGGSTCIVRGP